MQYFANFVGEYTSPVRECVEFMRQNSMVTMETGRYYLGDSGIFVNLMEYDTKAYEEGFYEAHRVMADLHVVICGEELAFYEDIDTMKQGEYHEDGDYLICESDAATRRLALPEGSGVIFMPEDAHMPCITAEQPCHVRKAVFKIPVSLF